MKATALSNMKAKWKITEKPFKWEWLLLAIICVVFLPTFFYNDIITTTRHSINLWNCIADGNSIFNFFAYNSNPEHLHTYSFIPNQSAAYAFPVYLVFAIWDFPLFLLERFGGIDVFANSAIVFYTKALLILALLYSANILKRICKEIGWSESKTSWATYIYLSSTLVMAYIVIEGQYDIFSVCFTLLGILAYLKNDKLGFIGWFSVAFMFKPFALILFIPLLLFNEKKLLKIFKYTIISVLPILVIKLLFKLCATSHTAAIGLEKQLLSSWFGAANFAFSGYDIYFFFIAITLLCIYCYIKNITDKVLFSQYTIYISFLAYLIFLVFIPANPYWFILLTPFITLFIFSNPKQFKLNLILESIGMCSLFLHQQIQFYWCYSVVSFIPTFLGKKLAIKSSFTPKYTYELFNYFGIKFGFQNFAGIIEMFVCSVFLATVIALIIINKPAKIQNKQSSENNLFCDDVLVERSVIHVRNILTLIISSLPYIDLFINYYKGYLT